MNLVRKSETFRFFKNTSFYVFVALMAIAPFFDLFMIKVVYPFIQRMLEEAGEIDVALPSMEKTFIESFFGITDSLFFQLAAIVIVALMVSSLYRLGPVKQLVSSGISRSSILTGELLALYTCFLMLAIVFGAEGGLISMITGPFGELDAAKVLVGILGLAVAVFSHVVVPFSITHITGSAALGIVFPLVIMDTIESTISIICMAAKIDFVQNFLFSMARSRAVSTTLSIQDQLIAIGVCLLYTIPFAVFAFIVFKKKDIK